MKRPRELLFTLYFGNVFSAEQGVKNFICFNTNLKTQSAGMNVHKETENAKFFQEFNDVINTFQKLLLFFALVRLFF
jgi:hypothetical protein